MLTKDQRIKVERINELVAKGKKKKLVCKLYALSVAEYEVLKKKLFEENDELRRANMGQEGLLAAPQFDDEQLNIDTDFTVVFDDTPTINPKEDEKPKQEEKSDHRKDKEPRSKVPYKVIQNFRKYLGLNTLVFAEKCGIVSTNLVPSKFPICMMYEERICKAFNITTEELMKFIDDLYRPEPVVVEEEIEEELEIKDENTVEANDEEEDKFIELAQKCKKQSQMIKDFIRNNNNLMNEKLNLEKKIEELENGSLQSATLQKRITEINSELEEANKIAVLLTSENKGLRATINNFDTEKKKYEKEIENLKSTNVGLNKKIVEQREKNISLNQKNVDLDKLNKELTKQVNELKIQLADKTMHLMSTDRLASLQSDLQDITEKYNAKVKECKGFIQLNNSQKEEIAKLKSDVEMYKRKSTTKTVEKPQHKEAIENLANQVEEKDKEIAKLRAQVSKLNKVIDKLVDAD